MLEVLSLASYGFAGTDIGEMLSYWEQAGFFRYLLPFLLIFALVFAILSKLKIFEEKKGVNGIIAFVVSMMSLQVSYVADFFSEIFPRLGIGLAILFVVLILLGIFFPKENWVNYTLLGIAGVIVVVILIQTAGATGWSTGQWWADNWPMVAGAIFILVVIGVIVGGSSPSKEFKDTPFMKALFSDNK